MKNKFKSVNKDKLLETLNIYNTYIVTLTLSSLEKLKKEVKGKKDISNSLLFKKLGYKDDLHLIESIEYIVNNYNKNIPLLSNTIDDNLPEVLYSKSNNVNVRAALSLVETGTFFVQDLPLVLIYLIDKYYKKDTKDLDPIYRDMNSKVLTLVNILEYGKKTDFKTIIETIGSYPVVTSKVNALPSSSVLIGFIKQHFNANKSIIQFIKRVTEPTSVTVGFVGNPIYHIRLFMTDLEINKFDRLKDTKKLLELKILEINSSNEYDDETKEKAINYYKDKIETINNKLDRIIS